jgi:hypothetical protein
MAKGKNQKVKTVAEIEYVCEHEEVPRKRIVTACKNALVPIFNEFNKKIGEETVDCKRIDKDGIHCTATSDPELKWKPLGMFPEGHCNMASHKQCLYTQLNSGRIIKGKLTGKKRVGQQKQGHR